MKNHRNEKLKEKQEEKKNFPNAKAYAYSIFWIKFKGWIQG